MDNDDYQFIATATTLYIVHNNLSVPSLFTHLLLRIVFSNMGVWEHATASATMLLLLLCLNEIAHVNSQRVPALFVFGDSLVEVGNNNFLNTMAKANFFPYGIDFPRAATGRFSNGRSLIDFFGKSTHNCSYNGHHHVCLLTLINFTGEMLGVSSPPPFADPSTTGSRILNGVNYASAASGILDESGRNYVLYHTCFLLHHITTISIQIKFASFSFIR